MVKSGFFTLRKNILRAFELKNCSNELQTGVKNKEVAANQGQETYPLEIA
jgi:hypothetical protein